MNPHDGPEIFSDDPDTGEAVNLSALTRDGLLDLLKTSNRGRKTEGERRLSPS